MQINKDNFRNLKDIIKKHYVFILYIILIAILSYNFFWGGLWFIYSFIIGYVVLYYKPKQKEIELKLPQFLLVIPLVIFFISRLFLFYSYGANPLGYDTGFYNYNINQERQAIKNNSPIFKPIQKNESLPNYFFNLNNKINLAEVESLGSKLINRFFILAGVDNGVILYGIYIISGFLVGLIIYLLVANFFNKNAALISLYIYSISIIQFQAYWNMFWKNYIALFLMLAVFYLINQKKWYHYFLSFPIILFVFIVHKTSAFILFTVLLLYFSQLKNSYKLLLPLSAFALLVAWFNKETIIYLYEQIISGFKMYYDFFAVKEGIFISGEQFFDYSFFYLPFGILSFFLLIKDKKKRLLLTFFFIPAIIIIVRFVFYKRVFTYFDLSLILLSGFTIYEFIKKIFGSLQKKNVILAFLLFSLPIILFCQNVKATKPLITDKEIKEIENIRIIKPDLKIFVYDSYFTPWIYGFSGHKIIAPGWGDLKWDRSDWEIFWVADHKKQKEILSGFGQSLIIYNKGTIKVNEDSCYKQISQNFLLFECK